MTESTRVLLVEDDVDALISAAEYLEHDGFIVIQARTGREAMRLFDEEHPDVAVLDYWLEGDMNGFDVCKHIKQVEPEATSIPVIFLSACDDLETQRRAMLEVRAEGFLRKPTDISLLSAQIQAMARIRRREVALEQQAWHDVLTGLPNTGLLRNLLKQEHRRAARNHGSIACLMIDVDHFKVINDTFGHPTGDLILQEVANRLRAGLRKKDYLGRYGGEEFTAILPETNDDDALEVAERLRRRVAQEPFLIPGHSSRQITISIGAAIMAAATSNPEDLVNIADQALLKAKQGGRNRVYPPTMGPLMAVG